MEAKLTSAQRRLLSDFTAEVTSTRKNSPKPEQAKPISATHADIREKQQLADQLRTAMSLNDEARIAEIEARIAEVQARMDKQAWAEEQTTGTGGKLQMGEVERTTVAQGTKKDAYNNMPDRE